MNLYKIRLKIFSKLLLICNYFNLDKGKLIISFVIDCLYSLFC